MSSVPAPRPPHRDATSVYRVVQVVATHEASWEQAAAAAIAELSQTIDDLRIARVVDTDVVLLEGGARQFRVRLAVSFRIDRVRATSEGTTTTVRRYLVVANQTITGSALRTTIRDRIATGPAEFHVVVPAAIHAVTPAALIGDPISGYIPTDAVAQIERDVNEGAAQRLDDALAFIRSAGADARGEVTTGDPVAAVATVLERASFDEIIVSTLPRAISRWLGVDLPHRLERITALAVTHVEQPRE